MLRVVQRSAVFLRLGVSAIVVVHRHAEQRNTQLAAGGHRGPKGAPPPPAQNRPPKSLERIKSSLDLCSTQVFGGGLP